MDFTYCLIVSIFVQNKSKDSEESEGSEITMTSGLQGNRSEGTLNVYLMIPEF